MSKFTPGPWKAVKKQNRIGMADFEVQYGNDGECIADVCYEEADASLIAAAPEMYEALEAVAGYLELSGVGQGIFHIVKDALKKANGEETK